MSDAQPDLEDVRGEILAAAERLEILAGRIRAATAAPNGISVGEPLELAKWLRTVGRARAKHLGIDLFHDPAWNILLEVYIAHASGGRSLLSTLSARTEVTPTTILSWLGKLEARGLIHRDRGAEDRRRLYLRMSVEGAERMQAYLSSMLPGHENSALASEPQSNPSSRKLKQ